MTVKRDQHGGKQDQPDQAPEDGSSVAEGEVSEATNPGAEPSTLSLTTKSFDRYLILERLGRGGMGVVYKAYDPKLDRRVALKVLRLKARSPEQEERAKERMQREAQALAQLNHPNVVSVYDVGAVGGDIYMTMEYIEGQTLKEWLREAKPPERKVLEVMAAAGRGIAAAHRAGLIHRDIKPSNIMIGTDGQVKVLDFGLARSTSLRTLDSDTPLRSDVREEDSKERPSGSGEQVSTANRRQSPITLEGRVMGTPGYMAPEQYLGSELNPLTDQFSFCVTLYEALYGRKPFLARSYRVLRYKVSIGRVDPPPPEAKVPAWLRRILLRGLAAKQADRYPSLDVLLAALGRDPRLRRRRVLTTAVVLLGSAALAVVLATQVRRPVPCQGFEARLAGIWDQPVHQAVQAAFRATGRPYAQDTARRVDGALESYGRAWVAQSREVCEATHVRGAQSYKLFDLRMDCLEQRLFEMRALIELFAARPDTEVVDRAVQAVAGLQPLSTCSDVKGLLAKLPLPQDESTQRLVQALRERLTVTEALVQAGKYQEALEKAKGVLEEASQTNYRPVTAEATLQVGIALERLSVYEDAAKTLKEAAYLADMAGYSEVRLRAYNLLICLLGAILNRYEEAEPFIRSAEAVLVQLSDDGEQRAEWNHCQGRLYWRRGIYDKALDHMSRALQLWERVRGAEHPEVARARNSLGTTYWSKGDYDQALGQYNLALATWTKALGQDHPEVATILNNLGNVFWSKGDYDKALAYYHRAIALWEKSLGPEHSFVAMGYNNLGEATMGKGDPDLALQYYQRALRTWEKILGPEHLNVALGLNNVGYVLLGKRESAQAIDHFTRSRRIREKALGADHPLLTEPENGLGWATLQRGNLKEAREHFERVLAICANGRCQGSEGDLLSQSQFGLARALWGERANRPRAITLARQALTQLRTQTSVQGKMTLADAEAWLRERGGH